VEIVLTTDVLYDVASDSLSEHNDRIRQAVFDANTEVVAFDVFREGDEVTLFFGLWEPPHRIDFRLLGSKHDFYRMSMGVRLDQTAANLAQADPNIEAGAVERIDDALVLKIHYAYPEGTGPPKTPPPREPAATTDAKPEPVEAPKRAAPPKPKPAPVPSRPPPGTEVEVAVPAPTRPPPVTLRPRVAETEAPRPRPEPEAAAPTEANAVDVAYRKALAEGSLEALVRFLGTYPDAPQATEASRRIDRVREETSYRRAIAANDATGYGEFLENFPDSPRRREIRARLQALEKAQRRAVADKRARVEAEKRARADGQKRRTAAYQEARRIDTAEAYRVFLSAYPDARESKEARRRLEAIAADDQAFPGADGTEKELAAYLETHPKGRHAAEARTRLNALQTARMDSDYRSALARGSEEALEEFLTRWPQSPAASEVSVTLEALRRPPTEPEPPAETPTSHPLVIEARRVPTPPLLDGDAKDPAWRSARNVDIPLEGGNATDSLAVRAVHANETLYLLLEWSDATRDIAYRPWIWDSTRKTYSQGEQVDDAVAVALYPGPNSADSCMLAGEDRDADTWIWRAHRSEISERADDGRLRVSTGRIPRANAYPAVGGNGRVWIRRMFDRGSPGWSFFVPLQYQGREVPSYRPAKASGSRDDVTVRAGWSSTGGSDHWTVEFARAFDTGHPDDVALSKGKKQPVAFAVYDKGEKGRHASSPMVLLEIQGR
jgi:hypothetical protein